MSDSPQFHFRRGSDAGWLRANSIWTTAGAPTLVALLTAVWMMHGDLSKLQGAEEANVKAAESVRGEANQRIASLETLMRESIATTAENTTSNRDLQSVLTRIEERLEALEKERQ